MKTSLNSFLSSKWSTVVLVGVLLLFEFSVQPLTAGPDRLIHDPAVYRLWDKGYMLGDWYTDMAVKSQVYIFYAKLVNLWHTLHVPEELWRTLLYVVSLLILYYALVRLARFFTLNPLIVPIMAVLHMMISTGDNQPIWLYGPFLQIDGGLAPRSIGIALSFLALAYLTEGSILVPALLLGLATLIHVSNSFIVFTLFWLVWLGVAIIREWPHRQTKWRAILSRAGIALAVYLLAGGWFALYVAKAGAGDATLPTQKFIWTWIYLRAPYMALPLITRYWWIRLAAHGIAIAGGWLLLRPRMKAEQRWGLSLLALIGLGSIVYFFLFYMVAFVTPWLPGFQFYSLRIVYFAYAIAYLFIGLCFFLVGQNIITRLIPSLRRQAVGHARSTMIVTGIVIVGLALFGWQLGHTYRYPKLANLRTSWWRLLDASQVFRGYVPNNQRLVPPNSPTFNYLATVKEPLLAPPNWRTGTVYLPSVVSFKSFGFTKAGLAEWYERMNNVSGGEIERSYQVQQAAGRMQPITLDWGQLYPRLTPQDVVSLSQKYHARLFLTYQSQTYPFPLLVEDSDYRLYRVPESL